MMTMTMTMTMIKMMIRFVHANRRPDKTDQPYSSQLDLKPPVVGDGSQPLKTDSGDSSGGFRPEKLEPLDPQGKHSKKAENYLDPATIWRFLAPIWPRLAFLYSDLLKSGQDLLSSWLRFA